MRHGLRHAAIDAVDHVAPWLLLGLGAAALLEPLLDENLWSTIPSSVQTIGLAVAALPLYLCAAGSTVLAALLVHKGISIGAALALVLVGPATSIPTLALVRRHHGVRAAVTCALVVVVGAVCVGMVADAASQLIDGDIASTPRAALAFLHTASAQAPTQIPAPMGTPLPTVLQAVSLLVLGALVVASLARQGVRGFVLQIMSPQHTHVRDHTHGPGCDHDHGPAVVSDTRDVPRPPAAFPRSRGTTTKTAARVALSFDPRVPRYDADDDGNASER